MLCKLFHKDVYFPAGVNESLNRLQLNEFKTYKLSSHLVNWLSLNNAARSHRYDTTKVIDCLNKLNQQYRPTVEVELSKDFYKFKKCGWFITKYVCRIPYNDTDDLVVVIRPIYKGSVVVDNLVVTAWMNSKDDAHFTLDSSKYTSEASWKALNNLK